MTERITIVGLIERVQSAAQGDRTSVAQILEALGRNSFTPNLLIPSLAVVSPLSGVPFFSTFCGCLIALVSAQMLMNRDHIWLPLFLRQKRIGTARLQRAGEMMKRPARWLDRVTRPRLGFLSRPPLTVLVRLICLIGGLIMPFLEVVPFTSSIVGAVVTLLAFGMLARDGLFTLMGLVMALVLPAGIVWAFG